MSQQQRIHVVVEKKGGCLSGCGTALGVLLLLGLTIQYWYVALPIVAIIALVAISNAKTQRKKAAHKPGPRDPWLNEVAVALADLGLKEIARNTGAQLGGAPIGGDIGLEAERFVVYVTLFSDQRLARQAELGLRAKPGGARRDCEGRDRDQDRRPDRVRRQRARVRGRRVPPRRGRSRSGTDGRPGTIDAGAAGLSPGRSTAEPRCPGAVAEAR
jgi:hypothetical protein